MKSFISLILIFLFVIINACSDGHNDFISRIDPGSFDSTWWNHTPLRFVQTNLREIDVSMDQDLYVKSLVEASANLVLLNVGGIVANYPTDLEFHFRNPFLEGDLIGNLVARLHEKGIKVIARFDFSKINEGLAKQKPDWLYRGTGGNIVNYNGQVHTCINGGYQQEYGFKILNEAITRYPFDAVFFNMGGYQTSDYSQVEHGICQCENCRKRFRDSTGLDLPVKPDMTSTAYRKYRAFQKSTSEELYRKTGSFIRTLRPGIILVHEQGEMVRSESGTSFTSGQDWNYHAAENVKRILGSWKNKVPNDSYNYLMGMDLRHTATSPNIGRIYILEQMLNGANPGIYFIGRIENQYDRVFLPELKELYGFHEKYEKIFTNLESRGRLGLIMGSSQEYRGIMKMLIEEHILFDLISPAAVGNPDAPKRLEDYEGLILANVTDMDDSFVSLIDDYVQSGGKLLATGFPGINDKNGTPLNKIRLQSFGVESSFEMLRNPRSSYLMILDEDRNDLGKIELKDFDLIMMNSVFMKCNTKSSAKSLLRLVPNTKHGPPEKCYFTNDEITEYPGIVLNSQGDGKAVLIPWQIGSQYAWKGNNGQRIIFLSAIQNLLGIENHIETDASPLLEMTNLANRSGTFEWIGLINHSGQIGAVFREPVNIHSTNIRFKPVKSVREIRLLRSGEKVRFREDDGWIRFSVPEIRDFEMALAIYR